MEIVPKQMEDWLKRFSEAVRTRDFAAAKKLFDGGVIAFGTAYFRVDNLEELAAHQWQSVWPRTTDFDFDYVSARAVTVTDLAAVIAEWQSTGLDTAQKPFLRRGRVTIVLQKSAAGWQAIHTHFSINPCSTHDPVLRHA